MITACPRALPAVSRTFPRLIGAGLLLAVGACNDPQAPATHDHPDVDPPDPAPIALVVSNPRDGMAWVSLPAGAHAADSIVMLVRRSGARVGAALAEGGFDPVAIPALVGDTIDVQVWSAITMTPSIAVVPVARAPRVVRTEPAAGQRGVAWDARVVAVFSEPLDSTRITTGSLQVLRGGSAVPGTIAVADAAGLTITFQPSEAFGAGTSYEVRLAPGITDVDGAALDTSVTTWFLTRFDPANVAGQYDGITPSQYVYGTHYTLSAGGTFEFRLLTGGGGFYFTGRYRHLTSSTLEFVFDADTARWMATGTLHEDTLRVAYTMQMALSDFEDGDYVRVWSGAPPPTGSAGRPRPACCPASGIARGAGEKRR